MQLMQQCLKFNLDYEVIMINDIDMGRRVRIIKNSDRTDAEILAENYKKLIVEAKSEEEKDQSWNSYQSPPRPH